MYALISNEQVEKYPYSIGELRRDNPQTSFPKNPTDNLLAEWNVFPVVKTVRPSFNSFTQNVKEDIPTYIDNVWTQQWVVENKNQEEAEFNIRNMRNGLLTESDWTQLSDAPVDKDAWAAYRQSLRDVTDQAGFPWDVSWPSRPE